MVNINKYKNDGWGLSKREFELLHSILKNQSFKDGITYNIVEFGSGRSTEFLIDFINETQNPINIYSFDDSKEYAYKGEHQRLHLKIVPLVECSDETWEKMFVEKKYDLNKMGLKHSPVHTRQKNTFYKIDDTMLPDTVDMLIVDGPHGNGRSLAYLHCMNKLVDGSIVLIDDASHYPFYDHLKKLHKTTILYEQHIKENKWENGGDFIICTIEI